MNKAAREKSAQIIAERRKKMTGELSTSEKLKNGKDTVLFGIEKEEDGYRVVVHYLLDGVIVDKKVGASQLKHHAIAMLESYISGFVIDSYEEPAKFFETVVLH